MHSYSIIAIFAYLATVNAQFPGYCAPGILVDSNGHCCATGQIVENGNCCNPPPAPYMHTTTTITTTSQAASIVNYLTVQTATAVQTKTSSTGNAPTGYSNQHSASIATNANGFHFAIFLGIIFASVC